MRLKLGFTTAMILAALFGVNASAQNYKFDFSGDKKLKEHIKVTPASLYNDSVGYGYDFFDATAQERQTMKENAPYYFSVKVPDGNYRVRVTLGSPKRAGETTVRAESRRLYVNNLPTKKGEYITREFVVNKRDSIIRDADGRPVDKVKVKANERGKLNWDNKLTFEINGERPTLKSIEIEPDNNVPTLFYCGDSTVVDQEYEPWASWGQVIPSFFDENVAVANYAESGMAADSFIGQNRLKKAVSQMKPGDYMFVEFGHNDQKQKGPGKGAYYSFSFNMKKFIDEAKAKGVIPVFITPTCRRSFDSAGKIQSTHLDFPQATRDIAAREGIALIELQDMTRDLYEAFGVDESTKLFVHYPANTYKGQPKELKDNTHFNTFGAYEVARCVVEGMKKANLPVVKNLKPEFAGEFSPSNPDKVEDFKWALSPLSQATKPDGN